MNKKYYLSICLIFKDENEYLQEWLEWHINQGVEHFYIYDNGSKETIIDYIDNDCKSYCTIINAIGKNQKEVYDEYLKNFKEESEWTAFIDTDEFIRPINNKSIIEFLKIFSENVDVITLKWLIYGANGLRRKDNRKVRERFVKSVNTYPEYLPMTKCIVKNKNVKHMEAHFPVLGYNKLNIVNEYGEKVLSPWDKNISSDLIAIDHYFTRSLEEWEEKINRGSCDPLSQRNFDMFYIINPDMKEK